MNYKDLDKFVNETISDFMNGKINSEDVNSLCKQLNIKVKTNVEKKKYNSYRRNNDKIDFFEDGK